jgi:anti-sigma factor RsiW
VSERCDRFARAHVAELEDDLAADATLAAHLESCADCRADRERYQRIARAMADLGTDAQRSPDHVARVLAAATSPARVPAHVAQRRRVAWLGVPLLAAATILVWWLLRDREVQRFAIEIVERDRPSLRGEARLGDRVRVTLRAGDALWIYRNDHELLQVCPRDCDRRGERLIGERELDVVGRYQIVWLSTDRAPPPIGDMEHDIAAAGAAGATHELREIEVR